MITGLVIQAVMAPFGLYENSLVRAILFNGGSLRPEDRIFGEKHPHEITPGDEIVDSTGQAIGSTNNRIKANPATDMVAFETLLLDTWDAGTKADLLPLLAALNKTNVNYQTRDSRWTPLMVVAGLNCSGNVAALQTIISKFGGNPAITDQEGWNALHWAAFHGSLSASELLARDFPQLLMVKDKEGNTPLDTAKSEGNDEVMQVLILASENKKSK
jgi:hypothetical protein